MEQSVVCHEDDGLAWYESNGLVDAMLVHTYYVKWNQAAQPIWRFPRH